MIDTRNVSLRDTIIDSIGNFLYEEKFANDDITKYGILEIIDLISDYHEEGNPLFPEIIITNSMDFFKTIPNKELIIKETELEISEFKNVIKLCAPLAINSWIIFIEINGDRMRYGLVSAEMLETSPSIYEQTVGELKVEGYYETTIAFLRNIGQKSVELMGLKQRLIVSLTLDKTQTISTNEVKTLCTRISQNCEERFRTNIVTYFEKVVNDAIKSGHGNLIGIVEEDEAKIETLKQQIEPKAGIYLDEPLDFEKLILASEENRDSESSVNLKSHASVLKSMLNHDGITIFTNKGRVLGYHILIDSYINEGDNVIGGARSKAFKSMENCDLFITCFYKSQDGTTKIWEK